MELQLDPEHKESKKLMEMMDAQGRKLAKALMASETDQEKYEALYAYYRKFYILTLCKTCVAAGINRSPTRDIILDYPWKDLNLNRFQCLKVWEKINH